MQTAKPTHLRVIDYDPEDFSLGHVLSKDHGSLHSDMNFISGALSLYFQWQEYRRAHFSIVTTTGTHTLPCVLSCDPDEREPTQVFVSFVGTEVSGVPPKKLFTVGSKIIVRFEIFLTDYAWEGEILDVADDFETRVKNGEPPLVVSIPASLKVSRLRRLPRYEVTPEHDYAVGWKFTDARDNCVEGKLVEVGANSLVFVNADDGGAVDFATGVVKVSFRDKSFLGEIVRVTNGRAVVSMKFENGLESGAFFEVYSKIAYPELQSLFESDFDEVLNMYDEAGFLEKFLKPIKECRINILARVKKIWSSLKRYEHERFVHQVVLDTDGKYFGAAGMIKAFNNGLPIWALTQMAVITNPKQFELTKILYRWRFDYLSIKPENFQACLWFDSETKWNERLWIKFAKQTEHEACRLFEVDVRIIDDAALVDSNESLVMQMEDKTEFYGEEKRVNFWGIDWFAGFGATGLQINGLFDHYVNLSSKVPFKDTLYHARKIISDKKEFNGRFYITVPVSSVDEFSIKYSKSPNSRFIIFDKKAVPDLLCSFEHTLAILGKKNEQNIKARPI